MPDVLNRIFDQILQQQLAVFNKNLTNTPKSIFVLFTVLKFLYTISRSWALCQSSSVAYTGNMQRKKTIYYFIWIFIFITNLHA